MVILIGGVSCVGKTLMAQSLLEKYHITYLSIDHVKMGLIRGTDNCSFSASDSDDFITNKLWRIIDGIIKTNIENRQNIIIEGCYIPPEAMNDFSSEYRNEIFSIFIGLSESYIVNNFDAGIIGKSCVIEQRGKEERSMQWFIDANRKNKERCLKNGQLYIEITSDYLEDIKAAYAAVDMFIKYNADSYKIKH